MSGGCFNYSNDATAREIFGYEVNINYGLEKLDADAKKVADDDPLEDREISELVYDVFCLLHSYDWYTECDTSQETYKKDIKYFKKKWFEKTNDERLERLADRAIERIKKAAKEEIDYIKEQQ